MVSGFRDDGSEDFSPFRVEVFGRIIPVLRVRRLGRIGPRVMGVGTEMEASRFEGAGETAADQSALRVGK